jgi:hypothetical protein
MKESFEHNFRSTKEGWIVESERLAMEKMQVVGDLRISSLDTVGLVNTSHGGRVDPNSLGTKFPDTNLSTTRDDLSSSMISRYNIAIERSTNSLIIGK